MKYCSHSAQHKWHHSALPWREAQCYLHKQLNASGTVHPTQTEPNHFQHPAIPIPAASVPSCCPAMPSEKRCSLTVGCSCWSTLNKQPHLLTTSEKMRERRALWLLPHFLPLGTFVNNTAEILTPLKLVAKFLLNLTGPEFYNFCSD